MGEMFFPILNSTSVLPSSSFLILHKNPYLPNPNLSVGHIRSKIASDHAMWNIKETSKTLLFFFVGTVSCPTFMAFVTAIVQFKVHANRPVYAPHGIIGNQDKQIKTEKITGKFLVLQENDSNKCLCFSNLTNDIFSIFWCTLLIRFTFFNVFWYILHPFHSTISFLNSLKISQIF